MELELFTERLHLRPFGEEDVDLALEVITDPNVMRYVGDVCTDDEVVDDMAVVTRRSGGGCIGIWCVIDRLSGEKLGTTFLLPMPIEEEDTNWDLVGGEDMPDGEIEIGYLFKPSAWGKGIATEAASRLLQFAFEDSPLDVIYASFDDDNLASKHVLEKIGLTFEQTRRVYAEDDVDVHWITKHQWLENRGGS